MLLAYAAISLTARPAFTSAIDLEAKYRSLLAALDETVHAVALLGQGSHSEHVDPSVIFYVIFGLFCIFQLFRASGRSVLYDDY